MSQARILISGVGRIGEALAKIIAPQEHIEIALWDIDSSKINHSFSAAQLAVATDAIFLCMPATAVRDFISSIQQELARDIILISLIKGLDPTTGKTMWELLSEIVPPQAHVVTLGGPMLSGELLRGNPAFGVAGTPADVFPRVATLFHGTLIQVKHSDDPAGVSAIGVLKNIYALGLGITAALAMGDNVLGTLTVRAVAEMQQLIKVLGGKPETVVGLAGLGDFVATGFSKHSRNRSVGQDLVTQGQTSVPSEGLLALPLLRRRLGDTLEQYPFLTAINQIVLDKTDAKTTVQALLRQF